MMDGIDHTIGEFIYRPSPISPDRIFVVAGAKDHPWPFIGVRWRMRGMLDLTAL
jgi:hypothetical protein